MREEMKAEHNKEILRLREEHRKAIEDLSDNKNKDVGELKSEIQMLKTKNATLQKQNELTQSTFTQQKDDTLAKIRED